MSKKERIASLERRTAHMADQIDIIISQDSALLDRIDSIERQIGHQDRKIDDLEKQIDDLETMIRHYIARVEEWKKQHPLVAPIQPAPVPMPWQNPIISSAGNTPTAAVKVAFTFHGGVRPLPTRGSLRPKTTEPAE